MGYIIIIPWLTLREPIDVGNFRYVPVDLDYHEMPNEDREILEKAVEPFHVVRKRSIKRFTLIEFNDGYLNDYSSDEIELFKFIHELFKVSCLSNRMFFQSTGMYINCDKLDYYIRRHNKGYNFQTLYGRRRDGNIMSISTERSEYIKSPINISRMVPYRPDIELLNSLMDAKENITDRNWYKIYNSVLNFNAGNTDNAKVSPTQEVIHIRSAFELLLSERELSDDFISIIDEFTDYKNIEGFPEFMEREGNLNIDEKMPLSQAWIEEFICVRDQLAHGNSLSKFESRWPLNEHLLLSSFIYPSVLKWFLQKQEQYKLTRVDIARFKAFEELASVIHLRDYSDEDTEEGFEYPWNNIYGRYLHRASIEEHLN